MKRIITLLICLAMLLATACGNTTSNNTDQTASTESGVVQYGPLGRLAKMNVTEEEINIGLAEFCKSQVYSSFKFYDNLNSMLLGLQNGDICAFQIDKNTAEYVASRNDIFTTHASVPAYRLTFAMLLREEDRQLCDDISDAILEMKNDGSMDALEKKYITDCIAGEEPSAVIPEVFKGAKTIKVAVTGDRPPMDYISATGEPVGFNTALVAEIGKRLGKNVEFVNVDSAARAISLSSGASDVIFWMEDSPDYTDYEGGSTEEHPDHTIITEVYLTSPETWVILKTSPLVDY